MNLYTIYNSNNQEVVAKDRPWPTADGVTVPDMEEGIHILLQVTEARPLHDPATQKLKRLPVSYDIVNKTATIKSWEVVDLTQEEIDAKVPAHFLSPNTTIKYDVAIDAQNAFTRMLTLVNETQMPSEQALVVKDVLGASIGLTVEQFHADMIVYGLHCYELFNYVPPAVDPDGMI
tara:strand:- start:6 stop:533 length:528 start_codon:yes stop_codon:yes gene_type:complete